MNLTKFLKTNPRARKIFRRQELKIDTKPGMVGFSWGIGVKISKFKISYGHPSYHLAGGGNYFSFSMNLDDLSKKF